MKRVIKFYAEWCGPCRVYARTWDSVISKFEGQVDFVNVNVDDDTTGLTEKYQVRSIPFTVLEKEDGSSITKTGNLQPSELEELILS